MSRTSLSPLSFAVVVLSLPLISLTSCRRHVSSESATPAPQPSSAPSIAGSNPEDQESVKMQRREAAITLHLQEIYRAMKRFDDQYGCFPCEESIALVKQATNTDLSLEASSSNDLFRQLFVTGDLSSENLFYTEAFGNHFPDEETGDDSHLLSSGECGFAYLSGVATVPVLNNAPLIIGPAIPGTAMFDPKPLGGKAVVLRVDGTTVTLDINSSGQVIYEGKDLLDPSRQHWLNARPEVKWPE